MILQRGISALVAGIVFGVGLAVSQMVNPEKVLAFLNIAGSWDPSLMFVMAGAIAVTFVGFRLFSSQSPLFAERLELPTNTQIDNRLVIGAVIFGLGWGLAGYCPGPAIAGLGSGSMEPPIFLGAMIAGSLVASRIGE